MKDEAIDYTQPMREIEEGLELECGIVLPCLCCGKMYHCHIDSCEARGIFNVFCPDSDCEDRYNLDMWSIGHADCIGHNITKDEGD